ncbi:putative movement protein [Mume virus A]|uniref:Putative movement protein n=1 Tax=Mume virus A TaxID=2137858 RepID=A0A2R3ZVF6_9VIRU|nr:putative movement protein [Mume virus A]AVR54643.1 putative movement protein [Mume virus A]
MSIVPIRKFLSQANKPDGDRIFIDSVHAKDIYSDANAFNKRTLAAVKRFQSSIAVPASCTGEPNTVQFNLFDEVEVEEIRKMASKYALLHIGAVLISVTCLFKLKQPMQGRIIHYDPRFLDKHEACQTGFSFSLQSGSAFFLYRPNYPISTTDPNLMRAARIKFEFDQVKVADNSHLFLIDIGVMYQLSNQSTMEPTSSAEAGAQFQAIFGSTNLPNPESYLEDEDITAPPSIALIDFGLDQSFKKGGVFKGPPRSTRARRYHAKSRRQGSEFINRTPTMSREGSSSSRLDSLVRSSSYRGENFQKTDCPRYSVHENFKNHIWPTAKTQEVHNEYCGAAPESNKERTWRLHMGANNRQTQQPDDDSSCCSSSDRGSGGKSGSRSFRATISNKIENTEPLPVLPFWQFSNSGNKRDDGVSNCEAGDPQANNRGSSGDNSIPAYIHIPAGICSDCKGMGCGGCRH